MRTKFTHYEGTVRRKGDGTWDWTGKLGYAPHKLSEPLSWTRSPRRVFVNSVSDVFHPSIDLEYVAAMWGAMALSSINEFQVLTKRPERAVTFFAWAKAQAEARGFASEVELCHALFYERATPKKPIKQHPVPDVSWPLPNVWLGTSVEDQAAADKRLPHLNQCDVALRWISCEPLIGPVDLAQHLAPGRIDWVVVGGESDRSGGPKPSMDKARPLDIEWVETVIADCKASGTAFFMKQGSKTNWPIWKEDQFEEFAESVRIREYPR